MSDYDDNTADETADETIEDDLTAYSVDDETQVQPQDSLDGPQDADALDAGIVANDRPQGVDAWGTTAFEQEHRETIDQRLSQEVPDDGGAYGRPTDHVEAADAGSDATDPEAADDADAADDAWDGTSEPRAGRLVAPDEGAHEDDESGAVATDVGIDGGAASAEEAAMHVVSEDEDLDGSGVDDLTEDLAREENELAAEAGRLGITQDDIEDMDA